MNTQAWIVLGVLVLVFVAYPVVIRFLIMHGFKGPKSQR